MSKFLPSDLLAFSSLSGVSFAIGYFIKYLGIHNLLDKLVFKFRREIGRYICGRLRDYFYVKFPDSGACRQPKDPELMKVFYEFINKQQDSWLILRALFFSYILKYGLSMNLIVFSILGIAFKLYLDLTHFRNDLGIWIYVPYVFFVIVAIFAYLISQFKVRREIKNTITSAQLDKIIFDSNEDLNNMLRNRFRI